MRALPLAALSLVLAGCVSDSGPAASTAPATAAAAAAGDAYELSALGTPPVPRVQTPPVYPANLRRAGVQGEAVIEFIVATSGNVVQVRVVRASDPALARSAAECVMRWQFRPGMIGGRAVNTRMVVPIVFTLDDRPGPTLPTLER